MIPNTQTSSDTEKKQEREKVPGKPSLKKQEREKVLGKPSLMLSQLEDLWDTAEDSEEESLEDSEEESLEDSEEESFRDPPSRWGGYFQSPVNKAAYTIKNAVKFKKDGTLDDSAKSMANIERELNKWLGFKGNKTCPGLKEWLEEGTPKESLFDIMREKFKENTLKNSDLYDQLICRLVRRDQLRYDPDYHTIYQLTPGQMRLLEKPKINYSKELNKVTQNQRIFGGVSETLQSLIAMFDSDLGKNKSKTERKVKFTKNFLGIGSTKKSSGKNSGKDSKFLAPSELNEFSPLRYWAPPPAFAKCVFHMIFWRSVITGKDLFNRKVIEDEDFADKIDEIIFEEDSDGKSEKKEISLMEKLLETSEENESLRKHFTERTKKILSENLPKKSSPNYLLLKRELIWELLELERNPKKDPGVKNYVAELLKALRKESRKKTDIKDGNYEETSKNEIKMRVDKYYVIVNWFNAATYRTALYDKLLDALAAIASKLKEEIKKKPNKLLREISGNISFPSKNDDDVFYPHFHNSTDIFGELKKAEVFIPTKSLNIDRWELGMGYNEGGETKVKDILKFIRDKILELILWSHYQMEIRSVGEIPVQYLYKIELEEKKKGLEKLYELKRLYDEIDPDKKKNINPGKKKDNENKINTEMFKAMNKELKKAKVNKWVKLSKVYGGKHREFEEDLLFKLRLLDNGRV